MGVAAAGLNMSVGGLGLVAPGNHYVGVAAEGLNILVGGPE